MLPKTSAIFLFYFLIIRPVKSEIHYIKDLQYSHDSFWSYCFDVSTLKQNFPPLDAGTSYTLSLQRAVLLYLELLCLLYNAVPLSVTWYTISISNNRVPTFIGRIERTDS